MPAGDGRLGFQGEERSNSTVVLQRSALALSNSPGRASAAAARRKAARWPRRAW